VVISLFSFLPVIFIFLFADPASAVQSLIGAIVLTFSFTGLFASQSVYFNKQWFRFQDMLVASKVAPASYAVGLSVSGLVVALPGVLVALALLLLSGPSTAIGIVLLLATSLLLWIGLVFVGFAIGATTKNARRANSIPQVLSIAMGFLPPDPGGHARTHRHRVQQSGSWLDQRAGDDREDESIPDRDRGIAAGRLLIVLIGGEVEHRGVDQEDEDARGPEVASPFPDPRDGDSRHRDDEEQSERQPGVRTIGELIQELRGLEGIVGPDRQFGSV